MIADILRRLFEPAAPALPQAEGELALAALLVRVARADDEYGADEAQRIDRTLALRRGLTPFEAVALRRAAETLEAEAPDTVRFTRALKDQVPYEDRARIIEALWEIALADGKRDAKEDAQIRLIASLLGVNDRDSALARRRVEADLPPDTPESP